MQDVGITLSQEAPPLCWASLCPQKPEKAVTGAPVIRVRL